MTHIRTSDSRWVYDPSVFLEKPFEGTAARSSIQPDDKLIDGFASSRLKREEEVPARIAVVDGDLYFSLAAPQPSLDTA